MKYWILWKQSRIDVNVHLLDDFFSDGMMGLWRLSIMLENTLYVVRVLVNSRQTNCDSLMELGQSSTSTIYSRFPEACLKRRKYCALKYFGVLHLVLLLRSSMNMMIHILWFLYICNNFCFAGIGVEANWTHPIVEEMFVFLLTSAYTTRTTSFASFLNAPCPASARE